MGLDVPHPGPHKVEALPVAAGDADLPADTITYSISGGADSALFAIDTNTGELTFVAAPDYEAPTDSDGNNIYEVEVTANDNNGNTTAQTISVTVTPVNDNAPAFTSPTTASVSENTTAVMTVAEVAIFYRLRRRHE